MLAPPVTVSARLSNSHENRRVFVLQRSGAPAVCCFRQPSSSCSISRDRDPLRLPLLLPCHRVDVRPVIPAVWPRRVPRRRARSRSRRVFPRPVAVLSWAIACLVDRTSRHHRRQHCSRALGLISAKGPMCSIVHGLKEATVRQSRWTAASGEALAGRGALKPHLLLSHRSSSRIRVACCPMSHARPYPYP